MARFKSILEIANQVSIEVGLGVQTAPFAASNDSGVQLTTLANAVGVELLQDHPWEGLTRKYSLTTQAGDSGKYDLPSDFAYMINQTGWDQSNRIPLQGSLSPQDWTYLEGRDLVSHTIYASFRQNENQFWLFPQPPPENLNITFEYVSRNWVMTAAGSDIYTNTVTENGNIVMYEPHLFERLLKLRFLEARGFDTTAALSQYTKAFMSWTGKDTSAQILNAGNSTRSAPYLDTYRNTPDTGFGQP